MSRIPNLPVLWRQTNAGLSLCELHDPHERKRGRLSG